MDNCKKWMRHLRHLNCCKVREMIARRKPKMEFVWNHTTGKEFKVLFVRNRLPWNSFSKCLDTATDAVAVSPAAAAAYNNNNRNQFLLFIFLSLKTKINSENVWSMYICVNFAFDSMSFQTYILTRTHTLPNRPISNDCSGLSNIQTHTI